MFTTVEIAEVTGGKLLGGSVTVTGVSTDTRTIAPGMLFVAIRGESFDGNDYVGAAAEKGAAAAISDRSSGADGYSIPVILVEDSRAGSACACPLPPRTFSAEAGRRDRKRGKDLHEGYGVRGAFREVHHAQDRGELQ